MFSSVFAVPELGEFGEHFSPQPSTVQNATWDWMSGETSLTLCATSDSSAVRKLTSFLSLAQLESLLACLNCSIPFFKLSAWEAECSEGSLRHILGAESISNHWSPLGLAGCDVDCPFSYLPGYQTAILLPLIEHWPRRFISPWRIQKSPFSHEEQECVRWGCE